MLAAGVLFAGNAPTRSNLDRDDETGASDIVAD